ncbi:MAG: DUF2752 domain-containing protein [Verrucomicrobiales bacterium]|nr:DUF2752 domain-containing protein [Verrucomicrobiales bacterium]
MESPAAQNPPTRWEILVPPGITVLGISGLLIAARFYDKLPLKPPDCGFRTVTGLPCLGCGGTRSMMALSRGEVVSSFLFNPLIFVGVLTVAIWAAISLRRAFAKPLAGSEKAPVNPAKRRKRNRILIVVLVGLAVLNWLYLVKYLPAA